MRIIFLDIDGVLNSSNWLQERKLEDPERLAGWDDLSRAARREVESIDPNAVALLNRIIYDTGALVVISSSWRNSVPLTVIDEVLCFRGFKGHIIGATPQLLRHSSGGLVISETRGREIDEWLNVVEGVDSFVILDDCDDMEPEQPLVLTNPLVGLEEHDVDLATEILEED